jgi:bacterial/archaeal transporter family-2 protein
MDRSTALVLTLATGALVAFQPPANALLGRVVGDYGAAVVSLAISTTIVAVLLVTVGNPEQLRGIDGFRPEHLLGGLAGAAIVVVSLIAVRSLGAGGVTAALVASQLIVSAFLDRFGALGLDKAPFGWQGWIGATLLLAGTLLITTR